MKESDIWIPIGLIIVIIGMFQHIFIEKIPTVSGITIGIVGLIVMTFPLFYLILENAKKIKTLENQIKHNKE